MKTGTWVKLVLGLGALLMVGIGAYVVFSRLSDQAITYLVGGLGTLVVVVVVAALLIGKDLVQAYILRRTIAQDDLDEMRKMAFIVRMLGGARASSVNVKVPEGQGQIPFQQYLLPGTWGGAAQSPQQGGDEFAGQYEDTTIDLA